MQDALRILQSGVVEKRPLEQAPTRFYKDPEKLRLKSIRDNAKRSKEKSREAQKRYINSVPVPGGKRPWQAWEKQFVLDHPSPYWTARELAVALNRSIRAVFEFRMDPDRKKRKGRYSVAYKQGRVRSRPDLGKSLRSKLPFF